MGYLDDVCYFEILNKEIKIGKLTFHLQNWPT